MMTSEETIEWRELVAHYLDGTITEDGFAGLKAALRTDSEKRALYLDAVKTDTLLREIAGKAPRARPQAAMSSRWRGQRGMVLAAAACVAALALVLSLFSAGDAAKIGTSRDAAWLSQAHEEGQVLKPGDEVELASGSVEILFNSGALTRLHGPARFEITSTNGGFLHHGQAWARAETAESDGFTIQTHSGKFVDRGTEFLTTASTDGFSQMHVASGAVDAEVAGFALQRFKKGSGLGIEPGDTPVMIRIESGADTPEFAFPSIPPPSATDAADLQAGKCTVQLISHDHKGRENLPHPKSGPPERLIDGQGQSASDRPEESLYFTNGADGIILLDLGREIPVSRIHTYSWHLNDALPDVRNRAVQRYTLWGCREAKPEALPSTENANGWTRIARVDTDAFFRVEKEPDRPAQQACAIQSSATAIGDFRYLLFQVLPTPMPNGKLAEHTFFGEIDVFTPSVSEPSKQ